MSGKKVSAPSGVPRSVIKMKLILLSDILSAEINNVTRFPSCVKMTDATIVFKIVYLHYLVQETVMDIKESVLMRYYW